MKIAIGLVSALALALLSAPAIAGDSSDSFHALSSLSAMDQTSLAPLADDQLESIEGMRGQWTSVSSWASTESNPGQTNVAINAAFFNQVNSNYTSQEIN